jgi:hypothetical protein
LYHWFRESEAHQVVPLNFQVIEAKLDRALYVTAHQPAHAVANLLFRVQIALDKQQLLALSSGKRHMGKLMRHRLDVQVSAAQIQRANQGSQMAAIAGACPGQRLRHYATGCAGQPDMAMGFIAHGYKHFAFRVEDADANVEAAAGAAGVEPEVYYAGWFCH